jgi:hypothetical protein
MTWSVTIDKVKNGYKLETYDGEDFETYVFEYKDVDNETLMEQLTFAEVFYFLREYFGVYNDKHANEGKGQYMTLKVDNDKDN